MASYSLVLKPSVEKDLRQIPKSVSAEGLRSDRRTGGRAPPASVPQVGGDGTSYRLRVGEYRIIYAVESDAKRVTVYYVRHRGEAYRGI